MKSIIAWSLAALASGVALYFGTAWEVKLLALLTPFVLWSAVLRGRIHRLERQLDDKQHELEQAKAEIQRLLTHAAALVDARTGADDGHVRPGNRPSRALAGAG